MAMWVKRTVSDFANKSRMIENGIARFDIAQKIGKRDVIGLRAREGAHDEVEISGGKPRPTIRPDHRELILRDGRADGKQDCEHRARMMSYGLGFVSVVWSEWRGWTSPAVSLSQPNL
jgi:hypothetical protein